MNKISLSEVSNLYRPLDPGRLAPESVYLTTMQSGIYLRGWLPLSVVGFPSPWVTGSNRWALMYLVCPLCPAGSWALWHRDTPPNWNNHPTLQANNMCLVRYGNWLRSPGWGELALRIQQACPIPVLSISPLIREGFQENKLQEGWAGLD